MRCLLLLFLAAGCMTTPPPSADHDDVLGVVQALFDVIEARDTARGAELTLPDATFTSVRLVDGRRAIRATSAAEWLASLEQGDDRYFEGFVGEPTVLVEGDVATVWTEYLFDVNGARSHTGFDAFNLVRTDDGWKLAGAAYSVVR